MAQAASDRKIMQESLMAVIAAVVALGAGLVAAASDEKRAAAPMLITSDGARRSARLQSVDKGKLKFQYDGQTIRLPAERLITWGAPVEPRGAPQVLLADGGLLALRQVLKTDADRLLVYSDTFAELAMPLELVAAVLFHPPTDPQRRDLLAARLVPDRRKRVMPADSPKISRAAEPAGDVRAGSGDRLLLANGDELVGRMVAVTDQGVEFTSDTGPITVGAERVVALALDPGLWRKFAPPGKRTLVGFSDGTVLTATPLAVGEGEARLKVMESLELTTKADAVVFLQTLGGQATYISDLAPASYRHLPYLSERWDYHLDANAVGTRLRGGGRLYTKGVGMHSAARLTFQLERPYRRFEAEVAIDDQTQGRGSVVFRLFAGAQQIYQSPVVRGGAKPLSVSVGIQGVRQLSLVVDYAGRGDVLDRANWLDARLME
jgi:hypothetical protein